MKVIILGLSCGHATVGLWPWRFSVSPSWANVMGGNEVLLQVIRGS